MTDQIETNTLADEIATLTKEHGRKNREWNKNLN